MLDAERCFRQQLVPPGTKDALALRCYRGPGTSDIPRMPVHLKKQQLAGAQPGNPRTGNPDVFRPNTKYDLKDLFARLVSVARASNIPTVMNKLHVHVKFSQLVNSGVPFLDSYASNVMEFNHTMWRRRWTRFFYCTSLARGTNWGLHRA